jgi:hypothetical protein
MSAVGSHDLTWLTIMDARRAHRCGLRVRGLWFANLRTKSVPYRGLVCLYMRTVKTAAGTTAVQVVHPSPPGSRSIEHIGSAPGAAELEVLKTAGRCLTACRVIRPSAWTPRRLAPHQRQRTGHCPLVQQVAPRADLGVQPSSELSSDAPTVK